MPVRVDPVNVLLNGIDDRLDAAGYLARAYAAGDSNVGDTQAAKKVARLANVGTGELRQQLRATEKRTREATAVSGRIEFGRSFVGPPDRPGHKRDADRAEVGA